MLKPYSFDRKTFLWNHNSIPKVSDGNIRDWFYEPNPPYYANRDENNEKIPYYTDNERIKWVKMNEI